MCFSWKNELNWQVIPFEFMHRISLFSDDYPVQAKHVTQLRFDVHDQ